MKAKLPPQPALSLRMSSDLNYITRSRDKPNCVDFVGKVPFPHLHTMDALTGLG